MAIDWNDLKRILIKQVPNGNVETLGVFPFQAPVEGSKIGSNDLMPSCLMAAFFAVLPRAQVAKHNITVWKILA